MICYDEGYLMMLCTTSTVWVAFALCSVLTKCLPFLHKIASHGKCNKCIVESSSNFSSSTSSRLQALADPLHEKLFISKKLFVHLYVIGTSCALYHLYDSRAIPYTHIEPGELDTSYTTIILSLFQSFAQLPTRHLHIVLLLWLFHNLRRLYESLFLTHYGDSRMHVAGYIAGVVHYITVPICFREACTSVRHADYNMDNSTTLLRGGIPYLLFALANYYQFEAHKILFQMKTEQLTAPDPKVYKLPTRSWFKIVCVPHYSAEVLIYLSLAMLLPYGSGSWSPGLMVIWVSSNLAVVAHTQHQWYQQQYPGEVPHPWYKLFPYIW